MDTRHAAAVAASAVLVFGIAALAVVSALRTYVVSGTTIIGAVMTADPNPRNQVPISGATVRAVSRLAHGEAETDASGFFTINMLPGVTAGQVVSISVTHGDYKPIMTEVRKFDRPTLVWLDPAHVKTAPPNQKEILISEVRIRYTVKVENIVTSGRQAKAFQAMNKGGKPCKRDSPCSPDGQWQAGVGSLILAAPEDGRFANVSASCIAGPCPFTRIDSTDLNDNGHTLRVTARSWSDTATFLVEADLTHSQVSDLVRQSSPVVFGPSLSFTLPGTAAGPSIEAELNGAYTVFPLGPALRLSWAICNQKENPDHSRLYSCELKQGYRFQ